MLADAAFTLGLIGVLWIMERGAPTSLRWGRGRRIHAHPSHAFRRAASRR